jgi:hypothetical protein
MLLVFLILIFNHLHTQYPFPMDPPPNTVTEVYKIGDTISGNEEYFIQVKNANSDGNESQVIYACLSFFYYQANVAGISFLPISNPYCIINYLNVPFFSSQETLINNNFLEVPDLSYSYLANYILSFALNFMQVNFTPAPLSCYSYVTFNDNLLGNLYQNPNQTYQPYQFIPDSVPQSFYARIEMFLNFENYQAQRLALELLDFSVNIEACKSEAANFYSTPGTLDNYTEYRCYTDPVYVISVRRNVDESLFLNSQYLLEQYPAEASVSYVLKYAGDFNYLSELLNDTSFNYAYVTGWGTTTKFQNIDTGKFVLEEMIKEIKARNDAIGDTISSIYLILGGVNCFNYAILVKDKYIANITSIEGVGFELDAGAEIINLNTGKNFCFDASCLTFDLSDTCLDEQNLFGNRLTVDGLNLFDEGALSSFCNLNFANDCLSQIENIDPEGLTDYAKDITNNNSTEILGLDYTIGSIQVYWYPL